MEGVLVLPAEACTPNTVYPGGRNVQACDLCLVLDDEARQPWSLGELERELGSRVVADDAVRRLHGAGLLHRLREGYVFPARATVRAYELLVR